MGKASGIAGYETARIAAKRLGVRESRVRQLCIAGRLPGAMKVGRQWLIPEGSWPEPTGFGRPPRWSDRAVSE